MRTFRLSIIFYTYSGRLTAEFTLAIQRVINRFGETTARTDRGEKFTIAGQAERHHFWRNVFSAILFFSPSAYYHAFKRTINNGNSSLGWKALLARINNDWQQIVIYVSVFLVPISYFLHLLGSCLFFTLPFTLLKAEWGLVLYVIIIGCCLVERGYSASGRAAGILEYSTIVKNRSRVSNLNLICRV